MTFSKTLIAAPALALGAALLLFPELKAAAVVGLSPQPSTASPVTPAAMKKEKEHNEHKMMRHHRVHHMQRKGRRMHSKGPGRCGVNMYYSRKEGHCKDARLK